jgi:hypothetical protein
MKQDDELDKLEEDIRKLKNKFDQFFSGIIKVPPQHERRGVEVFIHEINKQKIRDNTRRFRLNQLMTRYNQFREMWGRRMREREEGPTDFKKRSAALSLPPEPPRPVETARPAARTNGGGERYVAVSAGTNGEAVRQLFAEIEREHQKLGKLPSVTLEQLDTMVKQQTAMVRERYHVSTVGFRVETVDGKVKLKAKPLQDNQ